MKDLRIKPIIGGCFIRVYVFKLGCVTEKVLVYYVVFLFESVHVNTRLLVGFRFRSAICQNITNSIQLRLLTPKIAKKILIDIFI